MTTEPVPAFVAGGQPIGWLRDRQADEGDTQRTAMETVGCDLCGCAGSTAVLSGPDRLLRGEEHFTLVRCCECGLLYQSPRPTAEAIGQFYEGEYEPYVTAIHEETSVLRRWRRRYATHGRCKLLLGRKRAGRLLDVGCGTGGFLEAMRSHGWRVQGVEPNAEAARYGREQLGLEVFAGPLDAIDYPDAGFDAVTFWSALEHLPSPSTALQTVRQILKRDGLLVLRVPNARSLDARLFGPCWSGWDLPRHYYVFDPGTMRRLLEQNGFEILDLSYGGGYPSFVISCRWWMDEHWQPDGLVRRLLDRGLHSLAMRLVAEPFLFLIGPLLRRGTVMTVVACPVEVA